MPQPVDVLIVLEGGLIQEVFVRPVGLRIVSIDWDAEDDGHPCVFKAASGDMAFVVERDTEGMEMLGRDALDILAQHDRTLA